MERKAKAPLPAPEESHSGDAALETSALGWQNANQLQITLKSLYDELCNSSRRTTQSPTDQKYEHALARREYRKFLMCFDDKAFPSTRREKIKKEAHTRYNEHQMNELYRTIKVYMDSLSKEKADLVATELKMRYLSDYTEYILCLSIYFLQAKHRLIEARTPSVHDFINDFPFYITGIIFAVSTTLSLASAAATSSAEMPHYSHKPLQLDQLRADALRKLLENIDWRVLNLGMKQKLRSGIEKHASNFDRHAFFSYNEERHKLHFPDQAMSDRQAAANPVPSANEMTENEFAFQMQAGSTNLFKIEDGIEDGDGTGELFHPPNEFCPCSEHKRHDKRQGIFGPNREAIDASLDGLGQTMLASRHDVGPLVHQISLSLSGGAYEQVLLLYVKFIKDLFPGQEMHDSIKNLPVKLGLQISLLLGAWNDENMSLSQTEIFLSCPDEEQQWSTFDKQWFGVWKIFHPAEDSTYSSDNFVSRRLFTDHKPTLTLQALRRQIKRTLEPDLTSFQRLLEEILLYQHRHHIQRRKDSRDYDDPRMENSNNSEIAEQSLTKMPSTEIRKRSDQEENGIQSGHQFKRPKISIDEAAAIKNPTEENIAEYQAVESHSRPDTYQTNIIEEQRAQLEEQGSIIEERNKTISETNATLSDLQGIITENLLRRKQQGGIDALLQGKEAEMENSPAPVAALFNLYDLIVTEDLQKAGRSGKLEAGAGDVELFGNPETSMQLSGNQSNSALVVQTAKMQTLQALDKPSDQALEVEAKELRRQLTTLNQRCESMLHIAQEDVRGRVKRIRDRVGSTDIDLENFVQHAKTIYGQIYKEEDLAFNWRGDGSHLEDFQLAWIRVLEEILMCATGVSPRMPSAEEAAPLAKESSDHMFDTLQELCAMKGSDNRQDVSLSQIRTLKAKYNALMSGARGMADAETRSYESNSAHWQSLMSLITCLLERVRDQASDIGRLQKEESASEWLIRLRDRLLITTSSNKESLKPLGEGVDYMNFINEVDSLVVQLQGDIYRNHDDLDKLKTSLQTREMDYLTLQDQNSNLRRVLEELYTIFEGVSPHGSVEEFLIDPNRLDEVIERLHALYAQMSDPVHRHSEMWQGILLEQGKANQLQQPFVDDLHALAGRLQGGGLRTLLQPCRNIKSMAHILKQSDEHYYKDVVAIVQKQQVMYLCAIEDSLINGQVDPRTNSNQVDGAIVSLRGTIGDNWSYPDSGNLQRDPSSKHPKSLVQALGGERQAVGRNLSLDRDVNDQAQLRQKEIRGEVYEEAFYDLKSSLVARLGDTSWASSLGSCEDLDSVVHLICAACQSHDQIPFDTLAVLDHGLRGASSSPAEGEGLELISIGATTSTNSQITAPAPALLASSYSEPPKDLTTVSKSTEIELRSMLLDEFKSSIQEIFGSDPFFQQDDSLHGILNYVKKSVKAQNGMQVKTIRDLEAESQANSIALNEASQDLQQLGSQIEEEISIKVQLQEQIRRIEAYNILRTRLWNRLVDEPGIMWLATMGDVFGGLRSETQMQDVTREMAEEMSEHERHLEAALEEWRKESEWNRVHDLKAQLQIGLGENFFPQGCIKLESCLDLKSIGDAVKQARESHDAIGREQEYASRSLRETNGRLEEDVNRLQQQITQHRQKNDQLGEKSRRLDNDAQRAQEALEKAQSELAGSINRIEELTRLNDLLSQHQTTLHKSLGKRHYGAEEERPLENIDNKQPLAYFKRSSSLMGEIENDAEITRLKGRLSEVERRLQSQNQHDRETTKSLESLKHHKSYFSQLQKQLKLAFGVDLPLLLTPQALADLALEELCQSIGRFCQAQDKDKIEILGRQLRNLDRELDSQTSLCQSLIRRTNNMDFQKESLDRLQTKLTREFDVVLPYSISEQPLSDNVLEGLAVSISRSRDSRYMEKVRRIEQELQDMQQRLIGSRSFASELQEQLRTVRAQLDHAQSTNNALRDEVARLEMETSRRNLFERSRREYQQFKQRDQPRNRYGIRDGGAKRSQINREGPWLSHREAAARHREDDDTDSEPRSQHDYDFRDSSRERPKKASNAHSDSPTGVETSRVISMRRPASHVGRQARMSSPLPFLITLHGEQYRIARTSKNSRSDIESNVSITRKVENGKRIEEVSCSIPCLLCRGTVAEAIENSNVLYRYFCSRSAGPTITRPHPSIMFDCIQKKKQTGNGCSFKVQYRDGATAQVAASKLVKWGRHIAQQMGEEYLSKLNRD